MSMCVKCLCDWDCESTYFYVCVFMCVQAWPWMSAGTHLSTSSAGLFASAFLLFSTFYIPSSTWAKNPWEPRSTQGKGQSHLFSIQRQSASYCHYFPPTSCFLFHFFFSCFALFFKEWVSHITFLMSLHLKTKQLCKNYKNCNIGGEIIYICL